MKTIQTETPLEALTAKFAEIPEKIGAMNLSSVGGLCAAVAVCPNQIPENKWTALVWGKRGIPRVFENSEINYFRKLVLNYYKFINAEIKRGNYPNDEDIESIFNNWEECQEWLSGFKIGFSLDFNAWNKIKESGDEQSKFSLWVIINLLKLQTSTEESVEIAKGISVRQVMEFLPKYLCNIAHFAKKRINK